MKRLFCLLLCLAMALCGCAGDPEPTSPAPTAPTAAEPAVSEPTEPSKPVFVRPPMNAVSMPTVSESILADDGALLFTKTHQEFQVFVTDTDIDDIITADLQSRLSMALFDADEIENAARAAYDPEAAWNPYILEVSYTPTRIDQAVLSLFGNHLTYRGSVHPSLITESVTYDLSTGSTLTLGDILAEDATGSDICQLIIQALAPRAETDLYGDHQEVLQDRFSQNYADRTDWYFSRNGLCFHFSPYDIAPYSSGTIVAEIPYAELSGVIREKYLPVQATPPTGSMYAEHYLEDDSERFISIANLALAAGGTKVLLHPDDTVREVRIEAGNWSADGSMYIPSSTVFAADAIELGNAIVITAGFSDTDPVLRLVYRSGDLEVSAILTYDAVGDCFLLVHG